MAYFTPKNIQAPKPPKIEYWPSSPTLLNGGLNLVDREWKIANNQTSKVLNMWWKDGELSKRFGQDEKLDLGEITPAVQMTKIMYEGKIIVHIGDSLIVVDPSNL